jgi:hypothetical protein
MRRRGLLVLAPALAGCSVLPDRPYREVQRYLLAPRRPRRDPAPGPGAPVLLLRVVRPAPGLDLRGLRSLGPGGRVELGYWDEWAAPPAEAAEEALRRWLGDSGLFAAVVAPGSRLEAGMVMEAELVRLESVPAEGAARAALSVLLLAASAGLPGQPQLLAQVLAEGTAPLPGGAAATPAASAAAMEAALGEALAALEARLRPVLAQAQAAAAPRRR